jgi:hypothetical protein
MTCDLRVADKALLLIVSPAIAAFLSAFRSSALN